ncbi:MAG: DUF5671 domain-containing protein [Patescibacteria group bacterium]
MENMPIPSPKAKTSPKDFFLHLLSIVMLYASAIAFTTLIFQYINLLIPDIVGGGYWYPDGIKSLARGALATLIVVFPVYVWVNWFLNKEYIKSPEKRDLRIRKWLLYFTLFVAAIVIVVDFVTLVRSFLEGELSLRFLYKVLTVGFVAGSIFGYYLTDIKKSKVD